MPPATARPPWGWPEHFEKVIATDASAQQIESAEPAKRISYRVAPAEASGIDPASVDLILVAQALHWFDLDRFFTEAKRVLKDERRAGGLELQDFGDHAGNRRDHLEVLSRNDRALSGHPSAIWSKLTTRTSDFHFRNYRTASLK